MPPRYRVCSAYSGLATRERRSRTARTPPFFGRSGAYPSRASGGVIPAARTQWSKDRIRMALDEHGIGLNTPLTPPPASGPNRVRGAGCRTPQPAAVPRWPGGR